MIRIAAASLFLALAVFPFSPLHIWRWQVSGHDRDHGGEDRRGSQKTDSLVGKGFACSCCFITHG